MHPHVEVKHTTAPRIIHATRAHLRIRLESGSSRSCSLSGGIAWSSLGLWPPAPRE
jgi:hypothetical protein